MTEPETKICTKCGNKCPATTEYFYTDKNHKDGLRSWCILCCREAQLTEHGKEANRRICQKRKLALGYRRKTRTARLKHYYGLTLEEYDQILETQNGVCKICGSINLDGRRLYIDHDHKTGKIRGLLCHKCNSMLGYVNDDINVLLKAVSYLRKL